MIKISESPSNDNVLKLVTPFTSKLCFENGKENLELELVQFLKYQIEDNKKPIYGFTNSSFSKTIKGKRIASGIIGVKKTTRDVIGKLIQDKTNSVQDDLKDYSKLKSELVLNLIKENEHEISENLIKTTDFFYEYQDGVRAQVAATKSTNEDAFLDIESNSDGLSPINIKLFKEGQFNSNPILHFVNVTFVGKEGTITIQENTVLETYSFIANCQQK